MELVKKKIHMDRISSRAGTQMVLEEDVNISDNKPDASYLLTNKGEIIMEEIRAGENVVNLKGKLVVSVLYLTDMEGMCASMEAMIPFEEKVNMEGVNNGDTILTDWVIEDLTVGLINSRKLSAQAVVTIGLEKEEHVEQDTAVDIYHDEPVEYRKRTYPIVQLVLQKKDIFRLKEEMELTGNLPNVFQTIWHHITFDHVEFKALEEKISIQGEMRAFFLYEGEGDNDRTLWYENTVPFSGIIECHGCRENMIPDIRYSLGQCNVEVRQDFDGEERVFCIEPVLDLDIHLYDEENMEVLSDVYGVDKEIEALTTEVQLKSLLLSGSSKCKIAEHARIQNEEMPMYQLIHSEGDIQIEEQAIVENGIAITGTLTVTTLYLCSVGAKSLYSTTNVLPFQYVAEAENIMPTSIFKLRHSIEQLTVTMLDSGELDVKAALQFKVIVFAVQKSNLITDIKVEELDLNKLSELPGMVIYIAGKEDTLWDIGKRYYVPIAQLKEVNELASEEISAGDKILVVKGGI
ncbi:MAG: DUF3794 domain-containing protein [Lachnospiraceae bacterium]|nr:DUF3794 domain-containing protein [Lachnospiraceae bacterium]